MSRMSCTSAWVVGREAAGGGGDDAVIANGARGSVGDDGQGGHDVAKGGGGACDDDGDKNVASANVQAGRADSVPSDSNFAIATTPPRGS